MQTHSQPTNDNQTTPSLSPPPRPLRRELLILGSFGLLALLFTWPLALHLGEAVPGLSDGDAWQTVWNFWWVRYALEHVQNPFHTDLIFYPQGTSLLLHDLNLFDGLLSLPVQYLASGLGSPANGAAAGHNFVVLLTLATAAYGAFALARYLWGDWRAALVAGLAFGFSTYNFDHLLGHLNLVSVELIPFYILFLLKALHPLPNSSKPLWRSQLSWVAFAALALVALTFVELQYIFYLALYSLLYMLYLSVGWAWQKRRKGQTSFDLRVAWIRGLLIAGLYGLLTLPFFVALFSEILNNPNRLPERQERLYSADLLAYFYPSPFHPLWGGAMRTAIQPFTATLIEKVFFPGFVIYGLILAGLIVRLRGQNGPAASEVAEVKTTYRPGVTWWMLIGGVFALLSFGPRLHINGVEHGPLLPGNLIYNSPILNVSRVPARFGVITLLAFGLLAAWGLMYLGSWLNRPRLYRLLVGGVLVALAFELLPAPYPLTYYHAPAFYRTLAADPRSDYSVLELPLNYGKFQYDTHSLESQITSGKPTTNGYISRNPVFPPYYGVPVFLSFRDFTIQPPPDILPDQPLDPGILRYFGVRYIVVRKDMIAGKQRTAEFDVIARLLPGQPTLSEDQDAAVFEIPPGPVRPFFYNLMQTTWYGTEKQADGQVSRWAQGDRAALDFWTTEARQTQLEFPAWSFHTAHPVEFWLNGRQVGRDQVETTSKTFQLKLDLQPGQNHLEIRIAGASVRPADISPGPDTRGLTIAVGQVKIN